MSSVMSHVLINLNSALGRRQQDKAFERALTFSSFSLFNMEVNFYLKSSFLFWLVMQKFCFWSGFCHRSLFLLHCLIYTYFPHFFAIWLSCLTDPLLVISPCPFCLHSFNDDLSTLSNPPPPSPTHFSIPILELPIATFLYPSLHLAHCLFPPSPLLPFLGGAPCVTLCVGLWYR